MNLKGTIPFSFETERLHIRRYQVTDEDHLFNAARASIAQVFEFLPWCHPDYSRDEAREWLASVGTSWIDGNAYNFAIFNRDESQYFGGCSINRIDEHPIGNLGYWIRTSSVRSGIATEATIALAAFALREIGLQRIEIVMSVDNEASRMVAEKAGAVFEGTLRNRLRLHGRNHDAHVYSITPEG